MGSACSCFEGVGAAGPPKHRDFATKLNNMIKDVQFKERCGTDGWHVLLNADGHMDPYFDRIKKSNEVGNRLLNGRAKKDACYSFSSNLDIWKALLKTMKFDGMDFEHSYGIVGSAHADVGMYTFPEAVILGQTCLIVPVLQYVAPLIPKLQDGATNAAKEGTPILVVGMVGDCVKGNFFNQLPKEDAREMKDPSRLGSKIQELVQVLGKSEFDNISMQCSLPGAGAFGGDGKVLAKEFVKRMGEAFRDKNVKSSKFKEIMLYGQEAWYQEHIEGLKADHLLKTSKAVHQIKAVGFGSADKQNRIGEWPTGGTRVIIAGFDPLSIAPHGVQYRAVSLEGQLSHGTDMLSRIGYYKTPGRIACVSVNAGNQQTKEGTVTKVAEYRAWRYVQTKSTVNHNLTAKEDRMPNGDCLGGWALGERKGVMK